MLIRGSRRGVTLSLPGGYILLSKSVPVCVIFHILEQKKTDTLRVGLNGMMMVSLIIVFDVCSLAAKLLDMKLAALILGIESDALV